jgi:hypothetical protein
MIFQNEISNIQKPNFKTKSKYCVPPQPLTTAHEKNPGAHTHKEINQFNLPL